MEIKMEIKVMLKINEEFKEKGLFLSKEDLFDRLRLRDDMKTRSNELKQEVTIWKLELDKEKACKVIEYKTVTDDKGKWLTEKTIESLIKKDFYEKEIELLTKKATADLLQERAESIIDFVNIVKMEIKAKIEL